MYLKSNTNAMFNPDEHTSQPSDCTNDNSTDRPTQQLPQQQIQQSNLAWQVHLQQTHAPCA